MKVTATLERLAAHQSNGASLYSNGISTYWANRASFIDDYVVATVEDFLEAAGYSRTEISYEEVEEIGTEVLEINI
jgi:hypothetical protein